MKITLNQKRFLIVWSIVNLFALISNVAPIEGDLGYFNGKDYYIYLFTNGNHDGWAGFWPFVRFAYTSPNGTDGFGNTSMTTEFYGIFFNYNFAAFLLYTALGFAVIFLPKIWNTTGKSTN